MSRNPQSFQGTGFEQKEVLPSLKSATKLYFIHYSDVVIILFIKTILFTKLFCKTRILPFCVLIFHVFQLYFCLSFFSFSVLCFEFNDISITTTFNNICLIREIYKNFSYKEKSGIVTKIKLQKFNKHNQLYFGTLVRALYCYCGNKSQNTAASFKNWLQRK